jgi:topoisomerase-4 subunit A
VLQRRTQHRLEKIAHRLEILGGLLIVYLNLDEVIAIIRNEDEPKSKLIARFALSDEQAEAILNTRLRSLRKLEEMAIKAEDKALREEQASLIALMGSPAKQWKKVGETLRTVRKRFGPETPFGRRRSQFGTADANVDLTVDAFVTREPITIVMSAKGWVRALKGHVEELSQLKFKEGDRFAFACFCETTDKIVLFASDGRAFTVAGDKFPGGRGMGEPIRLMIELGDDQDILAMFALAQGEKRLVASTDGYGFIVAEDDLTAAKKAGKQVLNPGNGESAIVCAPVRGDHVAVIGDNRKLLVFKLDELPEMARGKGVKLQTFAQGGLLDAVTFAAAEGLTWTDAGGRIRQVPEWKEYRAKRSQAGKAAPKGFSRTGRFRVDGSE